MNGTLLSEPASQAKQQQQQQSIFRLGVVSQPLLLMMMMMMMMSHAEPVIGLVFHPYCRHPSDGGAHQTDGLGQNQHIYVLCFTKVLFSH